MITALIIAAASIVSGTVLALLPTRRSQILGPIRTFGLTASAAVVLLHLLPEVYEARGALTLLVFVAALVAPSALGPLMRLVTPSQNDKNAEWVTLRITYLGLLVHSVADGIALAAYSGHMHHGKPHYDVLLALSAHTVPVAAVMTLTFRDFRGVRFALFGALGLLLATSVGVIGAGLVPHDAVHGASAWVGAAVAGLLLHVVTHDLGGHAPARPWERALDLLAAVAGVGVGLLSGDAHSHLTEARGMGPSFGHALLQLTRETAPMLLLGLFVGALLQTFGTRIPSAWFKQRGAFKDAIKGAFVGIPLPLCSCSVLPISKALEQRGAGPALVVAFLLATPELGIVTFALTVRFLGWEFAWLRLGAAMSIAVLAALVAGALVKRVQRPPLAPSSIRLERESGGSIVRRFMASFDELLNHIGAWMVLGIITAAFVEALVPAASMRGIESPLSELVIVTLVTIPSYICAPSATPLAAVLIAKGVSPGAVLLGLLLGPATNLATLIFLKGSYGVRATVMTTLTMVSSGWGLAWGVNHWFPAPPTLLRANIEYANVSFGNLALVLLLLLLFRSVWRSGTRAWLGSVVHTGGHKPSDHEHDHDHGHGHAHGF